MSATLNAVAIAMPKLSDSMEEGTIVAWLKAPGDSVAVGDALAEIETDKATMTFEAEHDGVMGELLAAEGEAVALGAPMAQLLVEGGAAAPAGALPPAAAPSAPSAPGRVSASPVARRLAEERGVDLATVRGSGPRGRIVRRDVEVADTAPPPPAAAPAASGAPAQPVAVATEDEYVALTTVQRTIARRMVSSRTEIPEFTVTAEIDMTAALALRRELRTSLPDTPVSVNDLVVKAAATVLREQPALNASWVDDHVVRHARVNVGIAVATDGALLVPTVFDADARSVTEIAATARGVGERARRGRATPADLSGGTFTVTNLGMFGVLGFAAVINQPQVAILAVGGVRRTPAFADDGSVVARELMHVSLSCDHRAVYGADAARFLARLREVLEQPLSLLVAPAGGSNEGAAR